MGREQIAFVVPPIFSAERGPAPFGTRKSDAARIPLPEYLPVPAHPESSQQKSLSLCKALRTVLVSDQGGELKQDYLLWGLTMLRQSRSPRRRPWISTSAVAALEAKGML